MRSPRLGCVVIADRDLVASLKVAVGDRLQEHVARETRAGKAQSRDDQRQFALSIALEQVRIGVWRRHGGTHRTPGGTCEERCGPTYDVAVADNGG